MVDAARVLPEYQGNLLWLFVGSALESSNPTDVSIWNVGSVRSDADYLTGPSDTTTASEGPLPTEAVKMS